MMNLSAQIASFEEFACSGVAKEIETEVAQMRIDFDAPEEDLSELHRRMRSHYQAYQAAHEQAAHRLWRRLDEMADRVESTGRVL